ncbi:DUF1415 domain-containing protein [Marinimicrobium alkaliphilum]|uniref:DUF1415 domain-containing protein n=1 Tax=Marinimicrobium alkaliphilum TaxID=2202654 RepID=UPI000DB99A9D|nr:DUF1415 domain-containing protein [Marinimicrobium alkaliphilum]
MPDKNDVIIESTRHWVERVVIDLNLCPFAKRELVNGRVRFSVSEALDRATLLEDLQRELQRLDSDTSIETTLLIHPQVLTDFYDYNNFLDEVDILLEHLGYDGIFQVASFHPDYQFGGTAPEDPENYTNRAPYPVLHLLREASLEQAINHYPDTGLIPERNIALMNEMGVDKLKALLATCFVK